MPKNIANTTIYFTRVVNCERLRVVARAARRCQTGNWDDVTLLAKNSARLHISLVLNQNPLKMLTVIKMEKNQMRCPLRCLQSRFEDMHENPLFLAAHIFDHKNWPGFGGEEALMLYGKDEIKTIYCALQEWS